MTTLIDAVLAGSFPAILLLLTVFTGAMWLLDRFKFAPKRQAAAEAACGQFDANSAHSLRAAGGESEVLKARNTLREQHLKMPVWLDYTAGFFTVILAVFMLRSFVAEPFRIPSASMMPTLQAGDLILVNKFTWGLRMPVFNNTLLEVNKPQRGEVIVFRYPKDEKLDYIKRVIALPGDTIEYNNKVLSLNGKAIDIKPLPDLLDADGSASGAPASYVTMQTEFLPRENAAPYAHNLLITPGRSSTVSGGRLHSHKDACTYLPDGIRCTVPAGHYFVMGDNRDNSEDSRYWGFVPDRNIVGKAFFIWMNFSSLSRIGSFP